MIRKKYVACWFLVSLLMLLVVSISIAGITVDDMVDANQKIPIVDYANVNTSHKTNADEIQIFPGIQWLEFNSNGIDFNKVSLWSDDAVINTVLRLYQTEESWTGLNSDFRFVSKDGVVGVDVSGLVFTTGIFYLVDADDILEEIIEDVRSRVFVAVINNLYKHNKYVSLASKLAKVLVYYDRFDDYSDALSYAREVLFEMPDIPNLVKDKLFLFHKESSGGVHHDPCSNVIDGFIPGQVREDLVSNLWDGICRGYNPLVERFRHSATCKLIPTYSPNDGKVYVYDTLCSIKDYPIGNAIDNSDGDSSTGGAWCSGGPYPDDPIYDNDPFVPNADVSIRYLRIKGPGQSHYHTESGAVFSPGQTQEIRLEGKIKNESNDNADLARIQYCATTKKKFRHDERIWIDEDYLDHQEREHDFDPGESITKHGQAFIQMK